MGSFRRRFATWTAMALAAAGLAVRAQTIYVATDGSHDAANQFDTWAGAATNIHDAVDLANALGRNVLVSNGVYWTTHTVAVTNAFTLASVNGPDETTLDLNASVTLAEHIPVASVELGRIAGFTLRGGRTGGGWTFAGTNTGVVVANGIVSNCVIRANTGGTAVDILNNGLVTHSRVVSNATYNVVRVNNGGVLQDSTVAFHSVTIPGVQILAGGIARRCRIHNNNANGYANVNTVAGRLENSLVYANSAPGYHAVVLNNAAGVIENCTLFGNTTTTADGRALSRTAGTIRNTIIVGNINTAGAGTPNYGGAISNVVFYSCSPDITAGSQGNITDDPMFVDSGARDFRLLPGSPCIDTGTNLVAVTDDIDGNSRPQVGGTRGGLFHDMGAYEMDGTSGDLAVGFHGGLPLSGFDPHEVTFYANVMGANTNVTWYGWDFNNDGAYDLAGAGLATVTNTFGPGVHSVRVAVSNTAMETAMSTNLAYVAVSGTDLYVATNGLHVFPYGDWANAATNIHDAMEAAIAGMTVHIGPGIFKTAREIVIADDVTVLGSGRDETVLERDAAAGNFRMMTVNHPDAFVAGLMLKNGHAGTGWATLHGLNLLGGVASNITITACSASNAGRPLWVQNAILTHSVVTNNAGDTAYLHANGVIRESLLAYNGFPHVSTRPAVELAQAGARVERCRILGNRGAGYNGAAPPAVSMNNGILRNSLIAGNYATGVEPAHAGGVLIAGGLMENCTITDNANASTATLGSGVHQTGGTVRNCIISGNRGSANGDYTSTGGTITFSLAPQLNHGENGNLAGAALFAAAGFRLLPGSPGIDAGTNIAEVIVDLDGNPRPQIGGTRGGNYYDMGAYELDGVSGDFAIGFHGIAPLSGFAPHAVTLHANAVGSERTVTWYGWDFDNNGTVDLAGPDLATVTNDFGAGVHTIALRASNSVGAVALSTNVHYVSVLATNLYVATTGTHQYPYDTWAKAATNVHTAVDAAIDGCTVHIGPGHFLTTKEIIVGSAIRIVGNGPELTTLERNAAAGNFRMMYLNHANLLVAGMTLRNGYLTGWGPVHGIHLLGGMVSNVTVTGHASDGYTVRISNATMTHSAITNNRGSGVWLEANGVLTDSLVANNGGTAGTYFRPVGILGVGALVDRCRVIGNRGRADACESGVQMTAGTMRNTLVWGNTYAQANGNFAGGVGMSGSAVMENCTIVGNTNHPSSTAGAGLRLAGGTVRNCIIYGNTGAGGVNYTTTGGTIVHSLAPELTPGTAANNLNDNPLFVKPDAGDFRILRGASPCIDAGLDQPWMETATDLQGLPRVLQGRPPAGARVDMGAYETLPPLGGLLTIR